MSSYLGVGSDQAFNDPCNQIYISIPLAAKITGLNSYRLAEALLDDWWEDPPIRSTLGPAGRLMANLADCLVLVLVPPSPIGGEE